MSKKYKLSQETIDAVEELCSVLKPIYLEMKREGYVFKDGKVVQRPDDPIEQIDLESSEHPMG